MNHYYTAVIILSWMALTVLCILISENDRIPQEDKRSFYLAYALLGSSALAEWLGVCFDGNMAFPAWSLILIKCADYILTPLAGGALVYPMHKNTLRAKVMNALLGINIVFQILSCFTGWMVIVDESHHYAHGPLYPVYIVIYLMVIGLVIYDFISYGRSFRRQNKASLYAIMVLVFAGIFLQEIDGSKIRTAYLAMTFGAGFLFIHFTEFSQLKADDALSLQRDLIMKDTLTGVKSRYAYTEALKNYSSPEAMPEGFAAVTIDINGLKAANDSLGHEAGDELIRGAAECIRNTIQGDCFRTGGDEFVVLTETTKPGAEEALQRLEERCGDWFGTRVRQLSLAAGYALKEEFPNLSAEGLVRESDLHMYEAKAEYYQKNGRDRRRHQ